MSFAATNCRGCDLYARLAVKGIQKAASGSFSRVIASTYQSAGRLASQAKKVIIQQSIVLQMSHKCKKDSKAGIFCLAKAGLLMFLCTCTINMVST